MTSQNQPQKFDPVLGGLTPDQAVVMGGLRGLKQSLRHAESVSQIQEILRSALGYGREGIDIVLQHLYHQDKELRNFAYSLVCDRQESYIRQALALSTPSGVYYLDLQRLLSTGQWGAANAWTKATLKQLCRVPLQINSQDIRKIPCPDLLVIDRLWQEASRGRFGFSAQSDIWRRCAELRWDKNQALAIFGDRVGWRVSNFLFNSYHWKSYDDLNFSLGAPKGHLPWINSIYVVIEIHHRLLHCKV